MPAPMRDVIVLLPGILGSVLRKHGTVVWGYSARTVGAALFTLGASLRTALAMPQDDPDAEDLEDGIVADALMPDLHLVPGLWKIDGYTRIISAITDAFAVTQGRNFFTFPYDWRRDNTVAARRLARASATWLKEWRERSGNDDARLILIAHSMGGLVSRYFLECLDGWKSTRALVTFGTPFRGSLNALNALGNGLSIGPFDLTGLARELTSIYQLLPTYACYDAGDGRLVRVSEAGVIPGLDEARVAAAAAFHQQISAAVDSHRQETAYREAGYTMYPVVGIAQDTKLSARAAGGTVEMLLTHNGQALGGDGTVPRMSAIAPEVTNPVGAMYAATQHGSLQNADAVIQHLAGVLSGFSFDLGAFRKPPITVSLDVDDLYASGEPIVVRARPGTEGVPLKATLTREDDGQVVAHMPMHASADDWLRAEFPPQEPGAFRISVGGDAHVQPAEDSCVVGAALVQGHVAQ